MVIRVTEDMMIRDQASNSFDLRNEPTERMRAVRAPIRLASPSPRGSVCLSGGFLVRFDEVTGQISGEIGK